MKLIGSKKTSWAFILFAWVTKEATAQNVDSQEQPTCSEIEFLTNDQVFDWLNRPQFTEAPSKAPSKSPSTIPSTSPSMGPSGVPSAVPSQCPSMVPSGIPSATPSQFPSSVPSEHPTTGRRRLGASGGVPAPEPGGVPAHEPFDPSAAISCMIRASAGATGMQDSILTVNRDGSDVYLVSPLANSLGQRWIITNGMDVSRNGFGVDSSYNIYAQDSTTERMWLSTNRAGRLSLATQDDNSGRQQWLFLQSNVYLGPGMGVHNIRDSGAAANRFVVRVAGGTNQDETYLSTGSFTDLDLFSHDDTSGNQYWDLVDCHQTTLPEERYLTPASVFDWLDRNQNSLDYSDNSLSCVIRASSGANWKSDAILTANADGSDVLLAAPKTNFIDQRWIITNRHFTEGIEASGFGSYNIYAQNAETDRVWLSTSHTGNVDLWSHDDATRRQKWSFQHRNVRTGDAQGFHDIDQHSNCGGPNRFVIAIAGGTNQGETYLSTNELTLVDLFGHDESNGRQYWDLIDCYETAPPHQTFHFVDLRQWSLQPGDADCTGRLIRAPMEEGANKQQFSLGPNGSVISRFCSKVMKPGGSPCNDQAVVFGNIGERFQHPWRFDPLIVSFPGINYEGDYNDCGNTMVQRTPAPRSNVVNMTTKRSLYTLQYREGFEWRGAASRPPTLAPTPAPTTPPPVYRVKYGGSIWPNCRNIGRCIRAGPRIEILQDACTAIDSCDGFTYSNGVAMVRPIFYWGCLKDCGNDEGANGYNVGNFDYWEKVRFTG